MSVPHEDWERNSIEYNERRFFSETFLAGYLFPRYLFGVTEIRKIPAKKARTSAIQDEYLVNKTKNTLSCNGREINDTKVNECTTYIYNDLYISGISFSDFSLFPILIHFPDVPLGASPILLFLFCTIKKQQGNTKRHGAIEAKIGLIVLLSSFVVSFYFIFPFLFYILSCLLLHYSFLSFIFHSFLLL
jgi:hypothetical protein